MFGHDNHDDQKGGHHGIDHGQFGPIDNAAAQASNVPGDPITVTPPGVDHAGPAGPGAAAPGNDPAVGGFGTSPAGAAPQDDPAAGMPHALGNNDDLLDIKHQALTALTPLVGQLDQSPEEQFRTTMMMIQASDNHTLIKTAYDAAQKITNEKERAQALLDIVNEINYFTQHNAVPGGAAPEEPAPPAA